MGTSNWQHISYCVDIIRRLSPRKVLDIGVGFGRWGMVCREFLDVWEGRIRPEQWKTEIDGVEIFEANIADYHKCFYSNIYIQDAVSYVEKTAKHYDLIILGDVLEHVEKERAHGFLRLCLQKSHFVLLNIPIGNDWQQEGIYENPYERHLSMWKHEDFKIYKPLKIARFRDYLLRSHSVIVLSEKQRKIPAVSTIRARISFQLNRYPVLKQKIIKITNRLSVNK